MAFPTPLALLLPLAFAVSDAVPRFNIEPSCKGGLDSPGLNERYGRCISEENGARQKLESTWSSWPAADRAPMHRHRENGRAELCGIADLPGNAERRPRAQQEEVSLAEGARDS